MHAELRGTSGSKIADRNVHLAESLYAPLSPELKSELKGYTSQAAISFVLWAIGTLGYFVEWEDAPGVRVFILGRGLRPVKKR